MESRWIGPNIAWRFDIQSEIAIAAAFQEVARYARYIHCCSVAFEFPAMGIQIYPNWRPYPQILHMVEVGRILAERILIHTAKHLFPPRVELEKQSHPAHFPIPGSMSLY